MSILVSNSPRYLQLSPEEKLMRQFKEAAERVKKQKELESMTTEQRIVARLKAYMQEWKDDLDARDPAAVNTTVGLQVRPMQVYSNWP